MVMKQSRFWLPAANTLKSIRTEFLRKSIKLEGSSCMLCPYSQHEPYPHLQALHQSVLLVLVIWRGYQDQGGSLKTTNQSIIACIFPQDLTKEFTNKYLGPIQGGLQIAVHRYHRSCNTTCILQHQILKHNIQHTACTVLDCIRFCYTVSTITVTSPTCRPLHVYPGESRDDFYVATTFFITFCDMFKRLYNKLNRMFKKPYVSSEPNRQCVHLFQLCLCCVKPPCYKTLYKAVKSILLPCFYNTLLYKLLFL